MSQRSRVIRREQCPVCAAKGRDRSGDNLAIYDDGHSYCYACEHLLNSKEEFNPLEDTFTYEYHPHRGITADTFRFYRTYTKIDKEGKPIKVGFPYPDQSMKIRSLSEKHFSWEPEGPKDKTGLFGRDRFSSGSHESVTITEGEYDAQSLYQLLRSPVVSVQSSGSAVRDCSVDLDWLRGFKRIVICFDNDAAGREAVRRVAGLFDYNKVYVCKLTKHKDANEYLTAGDGGELLNIWHNAKKFLPDEVKSSFAEFRELLKEKPQPGVPYPFPSLTKMTFGMRKGESVLITAQEKVGKTELMHMIEHQLLRETDDAIGAIYLEEPAKRHLQALAGLEIGKPVHLPGLEIEPSEVSAALEALVKTDDRLHVYSHFGSDDPDTLLDTIRFLVVSRQCGWVLLDHISMVVSGLAGEGNERRALDYFITRAQMMVKELGFGLIFVSHLNDENQTRGSRYISKTCDIQVRAERDKLNPDPIIRNTVKLIVVDNRYSGQTGPCCDLTFDPLTYRLTEADNDNWPVAEGAAA